MTCVRKGGTCVQRIAVIGAGAAGLCAARHLMRSGNFQAVVYERAEMVGGTWVYTDRTDMDEQGFPVLSSMYKDLRTNLPKQVMAFPDFPFDESLSSFLHHTDVLKYLKSYCDFFDLQKYIKFCTNVEEVRLLPNETSSTGKFSRWEVKSFDWKNKVQESDVFDGVIVCNGHYSIPNTPVIEGKEKFSGEILHSHQFRTSEQFAGKRMVLFGARASGSDIALLLCEVADTVVLSHNGFLTSPLPENLYQESPISRITKSGVVFDNGKHFECDCIMFCTGYNYSFPFLKESVVNSINIQINRVSPLYKHVIHIQYPNLSFIGLCQPICPFPQFHVQVLFAIGALDGTSNLPSTKEMLEDEDRDFQKKLKEGLPNRGSHILENQWDYNNELSDACGKERISDIVRCLYELTAQRRKTKLQLYKNDKYSLGKDGLYHCNNA